MLFYGIDLAERHSAAVLIDHNLEVIRESFIDSGAVSKKEHPWARFRAYRDWTSSLIENLEIEDVHFVVEEPYPHAVNVAPAYRMQGAVIAELQDHKVTEPQVTIIKSKPWQDYFGYTKKEFGNSKAWAKLMAEGFGYEPGATIEDRKVLTKPKEDLRDAYMLARWIKELRLDSDVTGTG